MNERIDPEPGTVKDIDNIEDILKGFWERAHTAGELLQTYRAEKKNLLDKNKELESLVATLQSRIHEKEQELRQLKAEHAQLVSASGNDFITSNEREELKIRIKELISKINSHL